MPRRRRTQPSRRRRPARALVAVAASLAVAVAAAALVAATGDGDGPVRREGGGDPCAAARSRPFTSEPHADVLNGRLVTTSERSADGPSSLEAVYDGGGANGYSRVVRDVAWRPGDEVAYGASVFLPHGFKAAMEGQVALIRWDNYTTMAGVAERGGIAIFGSDRRAALFRSKDGLDQVPLTSSFALPEGRWVRIEVRQRLSRSDEDALSEVYVDGRLVRRSGAANSYGHPICNIRFGIDAIDAGQQTRPLRLYLDSHWVRG